VPFARPRHLLEHGGRRLGEDLVAPRLVVERAVVAVAEVGLVADQFMAVRNPLAAKLDSGVHKPLRARQLDLEPEFEVAVAPRRAEELVFLLPAVERPGHDHPVVDPPDRRRIPFPAGERAAVKERRGGSGEPGRGLVTQRAVRPLGAVFVSPRGCEGPGIPDALEDLHRQELIAEPPVEALGAAVFPRAPRLDVQRANAHLFEPAT
jgi:hypothetical protein